MITERQQCLNHLSHSHDLLGETKSYQPSPGLELVLISTVVNDGHGKSFIMYQTNFIYKWLIAFIIHEVQVFLPCESLQGRAYKSKSI